jgi:RNA polymerase sigma-70 factor, ECF subfamily
MQSDTALFDHLYQTHYRVIYAYLLGNLGHHGDREIAMDLVQETFLRTWRHLPDVRAVPDTRRLYWLLATARNLLRDYHRRQMVRVREQVLVSETGTSSPDADPLQVMLTRETSVTIDTAIQNLPDNLREVLTLTLIGGLNSVEIGKILETPPSTIRWRLAEARRQVAHELRLTDDERETE